MKKGRPAVLFLNFWQSRYSQDKNPYSSAAHIFHLAEVLTSGISKSLIVSSRNSTIRSSANSMNAH